MLHILLAAQSVSALHDLRQAAAAHAYGVQLVFAPGMHAPAPLQVDGAARFALPLQVIGAQTVPAAYSAHAPAPLHVPFVPHVDAAVTAHWASGSEPPTGTGVHVPIDPATEHE